MISLYGNYRLGFAKGDADGAISGLLYDLTDEYGRSSGDIRNMFTIGGNITFRGRSRLFPLSSRLGPTV